MQKEPMHKNSKRAKEIELRNKPLLTGDEQEDTYIIDADIWVTFKKVDEYIKKYGGSRELSLVKTKLEEALMWFVAQIQGNGWEHPMDGEDDESGDE